MIGFDSIVESFKVEDFSKMLHDFLSNEKNNEPLYSLDRKENDLAILENRQTGEFTTVSAEKIPNNSKDGDVFKMFNGEFVFSEKDYKEVFSNIDNLRKSITK